MIKPSFEILNQKGTPMFYSDVYANIPTAGIVGRMFISTDTYAFYRDTGSGWDLIGGPGTGTITGTGAAGQVSFFAGASTIGGSNNLFWDSANNRLGIGTATPGVPLDIHTTGTGITINGTTTNNSFATFQNAGTGKWRIGNNYNAGNNYFSIYDVLNSTERIQITNTGLINLTGSLVGGYASFAGANGVTLGISNNSNSYETFDVTNNGTYAISSFRNSGGLVAQIANNGSITANQFTKGSPTDATRAFGAAGNSNDIALWLEEYGNTSASPDLFFNKGRGSVSAKTNILVGDNTGSIAYAGYVNGSLIASLLLNSEVVNINTTDKIADSDFNIKQTYNSTTQTENLRLTANGGNLTVRGTITGTINALGTAGTTFLTQTSGLIQSRTAAQVRSDIGAQATLTNPVTGTGTNNEIAYFNTTGSTIGSLTTATYPSLTELSYVKGVTSALQTQLNNKLSLSGGTLTGTLNGTSIVLTGGTEIGNGQYYKARRSSGNLLINLLGIESGSDRTLMTITGDYVILNGSASTLLTMTTSGTSTFASSVSATAFIPSGSTIPSNGMYLSAANQLAFATNTTLAATITSGGRLVIGTNVNATQTTSQFEIQGNGYSAFHFLDGTAYYIGQNSDLRELRVYSGSSTTTGVKLTAGATAWASISDIRLKKDISEFDSVIDKICNIKPIKYHLKDLDSNDSQFRYGFIAQDLIGNFDEVLNTSKMYENDDTEYYSVKYSELIPVLFKAIQELKAEIDNLKN